MSAVVLALAAWVVTSIAFGLLVARFLGGAK